jgi:serine/threonine protein kinase
VKDHLEKSDVWGPYFDDSRELLSNLFLVAEHQKTHQMVALKFIDRAKLSRDTNDRVEREIQYLKLLRHPHIIKLFDTLLSRS